MMRIQFQCRMLLIALLCGLISACATEASPFFVPLSKTDSVSIQGTKNRKLKVVLLGKLPDSSGIGGDAYQPDIRFKNTKTWLKFRLAELDNLSCSTADNVSLQVSIDKLYTWNQNDELTGEIVLSGKLYKSHHVSTTNYRGECEAGFLSSSSAYEINHCLNLAMDQILEKMKLDICSSKTNYRNF